MNERRFSAMGCEVVVGGASPGEFSQIERLFRDREHVFSRFIPDTELNRVNARAGRPTLVSPLFAETLGIALRAAEETDGLVDPTLGAALVAAGYTRDWEELTPDPRPAGPPERSRPVFAAGRVIAAPPDVQLDLNGVVKARTVDEALALLASAGFVSAGGDIATRGERTVSLPGGDTIELRRGALATSGITKRRWLRGGRMQHHLIDPRTGRPATSPWTTVTACGGSCVAADVAAKAGFLGGHRGPEWLADRAIPARSVALDGTVVTNEPWDRALRRAVACT